MIRRTALAVLTPAIALVLLGCSAPPKADSGLPQGTSPPSATAGSPMNVRYDGRPRTELDGASITLPDFQHPYCPSGPTQFHDGVWQGAAVYDTFTPTASIDSVVSGDVNHDGVAEVIALISCGAGTDPGAYAAQVVALNKNAAGAFIPLGQVAQVSGSGLYLHQPEVAADGAVRVLFATAPDGSPPESLQWRSFQWRDGHFTQSGTSTAVWDSQPTQLTVTGAPVSLTGDATAGYRGTMKVVVSSDGGAASTALKVYLTATLPFTITVDGSSVPLTREGDSGDYRWSFTIAPIGADGAVIGTFSVGLASADAALLVGPTDLSVLMTGVGVGDIPQENADRSNEVQLTAKA